MISICIISTPRDSLYNTLKSLFTQKISIDFEIILILQGIIDEKKITRLNQNHVPTKIFYYPPEKGFGYYRNESIKLSIGDICVCIDDDEITQDENWLHYLISPILDEKFSLVTSGYNIPLGKGYWTDCISLLGYPGGGALGFEKVWPVDMDSITQHICSGNFSFHKKIFHQSETVFENYLKHGCEDVCLGDKMAQRKIKIFYEPRATVIHEPRSITKIFSWIHRRYLGSIEYCRFTKSEPLKLQISYKFFHLKNLFSYIFFHPKYFFGVICIIFLIFFSVFFLRIRYLLQDQD